MIRRLMVLNLVLVAALAGLGWQFRQMYAGAQRKRQQVLLQTVLALPVNRPAPLGKVPPLDATSYEDLVAKNLFSQDRNPAPIPDPPPPAPPPPPIPAFPVARGVMLWPGAPPTVVLAEKGKPDQKAYHPGDQFKDWTIVAVDNQNVVLEWNGQRFEKPLDELMDHTPLPSTDSKADVAAAPVNAKTRQSLVAGGTDGAPGPDMGGGYHGCSKDDKSPPGTIVDGLKKVVSETPFGTVCRWEPSN